MRYYLDSSALVKVRLDEPESPALSEYLQRIDTEDNELGTSILGVVEVRRVLLRTPVSGESVNQLLDGVDAHPVSRAIATAAGTYPNSIHDSLGNPKILRSSDAVHIATAVHHEYDVMVAYDAKLAAYAEHLGMTVVSPGAGDHDRPDQRPATA